MGALAKPKSKMNYDRFYIEVDLDFVSVRRSETTVFFFYTANYADIGHTLCAA